MLDSKPEIAYRIPKAPTDPSARISPLNPGSETLPAGSVHAPKGIPLPCDIRVDRDVEVALRDGTVIRTDVYRPDGADELPAIVAWSPYGKRGGSLILDDFPLRAGVPRDILSGLEKFEGPDPAFWCAHGYAVVHPDARGVGHSEGDIAFWGTQEARDGHDLVEWVAEQPWSNGKVGLTGNSWLAIAQWFIASERPPHLAAIAPWEGSSDAYRDDVLRGGIPNIGFNESILAGLSGNGRLEDTAAMARAYPLMNSYWEDKAARFEEIDVPAYVVASWTHMLHTHGTFDGFRRIASQDKWLRVHNTMEWPDYYTPRYQNELLRFFDRYLRDLDNGWETTPRVRISVLNPGGRDEVDRVEDAWPPKRVEHHRLHLDAATGSLSDFPKGASSTARYDAVKGSVSFTYQFGQDTELIGYSKLRLWVEAVGGNDMDLYVQIQKLSRRGRLLGSPTIPLPNGLMRAAARLAFRFGVKQADFLFFKGPGGRLRVSHRELDPKRSTEAEPFHTHRSEQLLSPGEVVPVEIGIWPAALRFRAGERLRVVVSGALLVASPVSEDLSVDPRNAGQHVIHTGGEYDSHLLVPLTPAA